MEYKKHILVCGSNGQLGLEMRSASSSFPHLDFTFTTRDELDITSPIDVIGYFKDKHFDVVVNCAAYTEVDKCEDEGKEQCTNVNVNGALNLLEACKQNDAYLIHISSDYVFNGKTNKPYSESDRTKPLSEYGRSKDYVEKEMVSSYQKAMIIRTSWLYSKHRKNFVKTMINLCREKETIGVVFDQIGTPTYAKDLAYAICEILSKGVCGGIFHYSDEGVCSWYDFAVAIHNMDTNGNPTCTIKPIHTEEFKTKATRPRYSVLDKTKIKSVYSLDIPHWYHSLSKCIEEIKNGSS